MYFLFYIKRGNYYHNIHQIGKSPLVTIIIPFKLWVIKRCLHCKVWNVTKYLWIGLCFSWTFLFILPALRFQNYNKLKCFENCRVKQHLAPFNPEVFDITESSGYQKYLTFLLSVHYPLPHKFSIVELKYNCREFTTK